MSTGRKEFNSDMELYSESPLSKRQQRRRRNLRPGQTSPATTTPVREIGEKYRKAGLPSPPQNPSDGTTLPYDEAVQLIRNGFFGDEIRDGFDDLDNDSKKRLIYHAGRHFGKDYSKKKRVKMMLDMHGFTAEEDEEIAKRFDIILSRQEDRDLFDQTIGAEINDSFYTNTGKATGITHGNNYGRQVLAIHRYVEHNDTFGFLSCEKMKELRFFFRWNCFGTCYVTSVCVLASYLGQMAPGDREVVYPLDIGKLIRSFEDDAQYEYLVHDSGGDAATILHKMVERLDNENDANFFHDKELVGVDLQKKLEHNGPGLVTNFHISENFNNAWKNNPLWEDNITKNKDGADGKGKIGIIRFDMEEGQNFEAVTGEFIELKPPRGTNLTLEQELCNIQETSRGKKDKRQSLEDLYISPNTSKNSGNKQRRGDRSAHRYSPNNSPENIRSCPRYDGVTVRLFDTEHIEESFEAMGGSQLDQTEVRDRPPRSESDNQSEKVVTHSMICIGGRIADGKSFLLLQNSWSRMPLVEVSLAYFRAAQASLTCVNHNNIKFFRRLNQKDCFYKINKAMVADCSN